MPTDNHRLPRTVEPKRYDLLLRPDLRAATFSGEARIEVWAHEPTSEVVVNAAELEITSVVRATDEGTLMPATVTLDEVAERATFAFADPIPEGRHTLQVAFSGILNDDLRGFHRLEYTDDQGNRRLMAATQFQATDARRAFPCWDEPDRKAVFGVTLVVDEGLDVVSNSELAETGTDGPGRVRARFADTMRMSTYLVAFFVGHFEFTDPVDVDGVALRVVTRPGKAHLGAFATEVAAHALRFFSSYFGLPCPIAKLDLIALPDFAAGAMENLGAVTFRENLLLVDAEQATQEELERIADTASHEIAHTWFGNLVTMRWWNGIWLNEAFATFMALLCVNNFRPAFERWVTFGLSRDRAMVIDGLRATRPVEFPVVSPEDAEAMFDAITYDKGSAILRMIEQYVGAEPFRQGISSYIEKHRWSSTDTPDLWDAVEAATTEPVRDVMDSWVYQEGFPLVEVALDGTGAALTLSKRRFTYGANLGWAHAERKVPVLVRTSAGGRVVRPRVLLEAAPATIELDGPLEWAVVNDGGWGFFRTTYGPELWPRLIGQLTRLQPLERLTLVNDTWATALAGLAPLSRFVDLAGRLGNERNPAMWSALMSALDLLERIVPHGERAALHAFVRELAGPGLAELGWAPVPDEGHRECKVRAQLIEAMGVLGADGATRQQALRAHERYLADRSLDVDLAAAALAVVAATGGDAEYDAVLQRARRAETPQEGIRCLLALADFPHEHLVRRTTDLARTEVRSSDGPRLVSRLLANRRHGHVAWGLVKEHWDELTARFPESLHDRMVEGVAYLVEPGLATDVKAFLAHHPLPVRQRSVDQLLERLDIALAFRQREAAGLGRLLAGSGPPQQAEN